MISENIFGIGDLFLNTSKMQRAWQIWLLPTLFFILDYAAVVAAEWSAIALRNAVDYWMHSVYRIPSIYLYLWVPAFFLLFLKLNHTYQSQQPIVDIIRRIFYAVLGGLLTSVVIIYFMHAAQTVSRLFFVLFAVFVLFYIYAVRYILLHYLKDNHDFYEPVLLIGAGKTAERVLRFFDGDLGYRYQVIGVLDDGPGLESVTKRCRHLGGLHRAERIAKHMHVGTVLITAPGLEKEKLQALITGMQPYVRNIAFVPDLIGTPMADVQVNVLFSEKIMMLGLRNNLARRSNRIMKRIFDLTATILGGAVISPFLLLLVLIVFIDNKGRVIFAHRRVGQHGKEFNCYKFQSMVPDAQKRLEEYLAANPEAKKEWEENFKLEHDPRVTKLGAFLRRTSLDELPQLWNVIMGDMSLVGPRPIVQAEVPKYGPYIREYYMVPPGITGMWQVSGRSDTTYEERVAMDTWYVRNWSVWIDLVFLFKTIKAVACGKGAY